MWTEVSRSCKAVNCRTVIHWECERTGDLDAKVKTLLRALRLDDIAFCKLARLNHPKKVWEAGAPAKLVVRLREELLVLCHGYTAKSVRSI